MEPTAPTPSARDGAGRWAPGTSGNPGGRPKSKACLTEALRQELDRPATLPDGSTGTQAELLAARIVVLALGGERWAAELCWDRLEGPPRPPIEDDDPFQIRGLPVVSLPPHLCRPGGGAADGQAE